MFMYTVRIEIDQAIQRRISRMMIDCIIFVVQTMHQTLKSKTQLTTDLTKTKVSSNPLTPAIRLSL